eukprot:5073127-Pleurochrysis_carterae.AAC.1
MDDQFWTEMNNFGRINGHPTPDITHASPPCNEFSAFRCLGIHEGQGPPTAQMLLKTLHHLEEYRFRRVQLDGVHVPWAVENILGAKGTVSEMFYTPTVLCGTMFGHRVFCHRLLFSSDQLQLHLNCAHAGKHVGSRGHSKYQSRPSNMYGPYSWHRAFRGSTDDLHFAM